METKGSRVPAEHPHPKISKVLPSPGLRVIFILLTLCIWLLHLFLLHGKNSIASKCPSTNSDLRSSRKLEENTEDKTEAMLDIPAKPQTTENTSQTTISTTVLSCNCRKCCPAVNSTKLEISYRRLFSYMLMCEVVY